MKIGHSLISSMTVRKVGSTWNGNGLLFPTLKNGLTFQQTFDKCTELAGAKKVKEAENKWPLFTACKDPLIAFE